MTRALRAPRPTPEPALLLALLRIAVAAVVLVAQEPAIARVVAERPPDLWIAPEGLGWLGTLVPLTPRTIAVASASLQASAALALLGVWTRPALVVLAATQLYVFGTAQLTGTVTHDMHLFWLACLLACAPSGEALSLDAWARRAPLLGGPPSATSTWAVATARLWLGLIYFFPGVHKLKTGGLGWITGDGLVNQMHFKWFEAGGVVPWPRIDQAPLLLSIAAGLVVAFELAMPSLVLWRRTRPIALAAGVVFHLAAGHFLDVLFPGLLACYVVLLPGERLRTRNATAPRPGGANDRPPVLLAAVVLAFTTAIVVQGARAQTQSYPFACYPTFEHGAPAEIVDLAVDVRSAAQREPLTFRLPRVRRQDEWGTVWRLGGLYGDAIDPARLRAFAAAVVPRDTLASAASVSFVLEAYDVRPEAWTEPPRRRWAIHTDP